MLSNASIPIVDVVRHSVGIVVWTVEEFASIHRKNRTIVPMNGSLYTRSNVTRLSLPRKDRGRGLIGIKVCGNKRRKAFHGYLSGCCKWHWRRKCLLKKITFNYDCQRTRKERNALHEEFAWQTASWSDVGGEDPWIWLKNVCRRLDTRCSRTRFENKFDPAQHI